MASTKILYTSTLVLAGLAGAATGWSARPPEVRYMTFEEKLLAEYDARYRLTARERETLRGILRDFSVEMDALRREFDRKFGDQVDALKDTFDARIGAIATPEKRR